MKTPSANRTRHARTVLVEERACHSLEPVLLYRVGEILPPSAGRVRMRQRAGAQRWGSMHARRGYPWTALSQRSSTKVQGNIQDPNASAARVLCSTTGRRAHASFPSLRQIRTCVLPSGVGGSVWSGAFDRLTQALPHHGAASIPRHGSKQKFCFGERTQRIASAYDRYIYTFSE